MDGEATTSPRPQGRDDPDPLADLVALERVVLGLEERLAERDARILLLEGEAARLRRRLAAADRRLGRDRGPAEGGRAARLGRRAARLLRRFLFALDWRLHRWAGRLRGRRP